MTELNDKHGNRMICLVIHQQLHALCTKTARTDERLPTRPKIISNSELPRSLILDLF